MKLKIKYYTCGVGILLLYIFVKYWYKDLKVEKQTFVKTDKIRTTQETEWSIDREVTFILRYSHETSKYLAGTVNSLLFLFSLTPIIIVSDTIISREIVSNFPNTTKISYIPLKLDLLNLIVDRNVANHIKTKYIFILPVGVVSFLPKDILQLSETLKQDNNSVIAVPVDKKVLRCLKLELNFMQWTIQYKRNDYGMNCDVVQGDHGIFAYSYMLKRFGEPFLLPFPEAFYIQAASLGIKAKPIHDVILKSKNKKANDIKRPEFAMKAQIHRQLMFKQFKIKKVIRESGLIEWYGCTRDTQRCFPNVVNLVPEYLNQGRWTPPCCLRVLRETVRHVFKVLKDSNVTFWLEGGSLLGAVRMKDIIPWDYDVDIGVYLEDIDRCPWLRTIHHGKFEKKQLPSVVDNEGFVWEKASPEEGDFYRVQASVHNRLHIDIFPFFSINGIMTKKTWFGSHPQDKEFPEHYLKPLTTIEFAGIQAPAPNNVKEFLEFKFGKGCVENPKYPNSKLFPFPDNVRQLVVNDTFNYEQAFNFP